MLVSILALSQAIILPIIYAILLAMLMSPVVNFLVKHKFPRAVAVIVVMLSVTLVLAGLIVLLSTQALRLSNAWPQLVVKFQELLLQLVQWISASFNLSELSINTWIADAKAELMAGSNAAIGHTLTSMGSTLAAAFLTPVYVFMILFYQPHLVAFTHRLFGTINNDKVSEMLKVMEGVIKSYLVGLFLEFVILAILNSLGLLLLGFDYAVLLGLMGAMLNVIPYIGGLITICIFSIVALITKTPVYVLYAFVLQTTIQFIDNNYIVPSVVGSKVKLNALFSLLAVILGAALWGVPGMLLSIPIAAILKLSFDRIHTLKPWGFLLGDIQITKSNFGLGHRIKLYLQKLMSRRIHR